MTAFDQGLVALLGKRGVSRRAFLRFSATMAGVLALPPSFAPRIAAALEKAPRIPVIWREGQDCAGNTEGFLRASHPTVADLILDVLSVDYHETLMAPAGAAAEESVLATMEKYPNEYLGFMVHHVHSGTLVDHWERNGLMSSMFTGYKFATRQEVIEARDGGMDVEEVIE